MESMVMQVWVAVDIPCVVIGTTGACEPAKVAGQRQHVKLEINLNGEHDEEYERQWALECKHCSGPSHGILC